MASSQLTQGFSWGTALTIGVGVVVGVVLAGLLGRVLA